MLGYLPCSNKSKKDMERSMRHVGPIVTDHTVHMLMVAMVLFDSQDTDVAVRRAHSVSINMLRGYLEANSSFPEMELHRVLQSVKDVPSIWAARNKVLMETLTFVPSIKKQRMNEATGQNKNM
jgi:hypothetical protein